MKLCLSYSTTPANALLTLSIVIADNLNGEVADRLRDVLVEGGGEYFSGCPEILYAKDRVFNGEVGSEGADERPTPFRGK